MWRNRKARKNVRTREAENYGEQGESAKKEKERLNEGSKEANKKSSTERYKYRKRSNKKIATWRGRMEKEMKERKIVKEK
jgi:hypothetical protein